jgi:hypothetical protein
MNVLWTHTAEQNFLSFNPFPEERQQVNETLLNVARRHDAGLHIPWTRFFFFKFNCLVIDSGRFAIVYRFKASRVAVLAVRLVRELE